MTAAFRPSLERLADRICPAAHHVIRPHFLLVACVASEDSGTLLIIEDMGHGQWCPDAVVPLAAKTTLGPRGLQLYAAQQLAILPGLSDDAARVMAAHIDALAIPVTDPSVNAWLTYGG